MIRTPPPPLDADVYVRNLRAHYVSQALETLASEPEPDACPEGANLVRDVTLIETLATDPIALATAHVHLMRAYQDLRERVDGLCAREAV